MEQTLERLVATIGRLEGVINNDQAEMKAKEARMDAILKEIKEDIRINHEEVNSSQEQTAEMDAWLAEIRAWRKETTTCLEAMKARLESREPTSVKIPAESIVVHEEVPKEKAAVQTITAPKKRTHGNGGPRKKLAAACRGMTRHAFPARPKGHCCRGQEKDKAVQGTSKGRRLGERRREQSESNNGMKDRDLRERLHLTSKRTSGSIYKKALVPEMVKRRV
jgi:hypothetical protein